MTLLLHPLPHRASGASVGDFRSSSGVVVVGAPPGAAWEGRLLLSPSQPVLTKIDSIIMAICSGTGAAYSSLHILVDLSLVQSQPMLTKADSIIMAIWSGVGAA